MGNFSLPLSTAMRDKIQALVEDGVHSVAEMKRHLKHYIRTELCCNNPPDNTNRRYYPSNRTLRNIIYRARTAKVKSKIDQVNLRIKIGEWQKNDDNVYFREYVEPSNTVAGEDVHNSDTDGDDNSDNDDDNDDVYLNTGSLSAKTGLLFCHQTLWQKKLLMKYGNEICLLDATYKTCKYAMPLFFVCVKTNVDYVVVASFVTQAEDTASISEALAIIRNWNPDWHPTNWMVDFSEMEINALNATFQGFCC